MDGNEVIAVPVMVPANKIGALYAAVAAIMGASVAAAALPTPRGSTAAEAAKPSTTEAKAADPAPAAAEPASGGATAGDASGEVDAGGHPWSADLHAATKSKTKEGLWRMKVGVSRPDPLPGSPAATGAAPATTEPAKAADPAPAAGEDDEFAAFREAAAKSDAKDARAAASVAARKWTDTDLSKLCNEAATKLGDPTPVKELIQAHVPAGTVPHSRNIPEDKREDFAKAVEAKAGFTFEG